MRLPITPKPTNPKLAILNSVRAMKTLCVLNLYRHEQICVPMNTQVGQPTQPPTISPSSSVRKIGIGVAVIMRDGNAKSRGSCFGCDAERSCLRGAASHCRHSIPALSLAAGDG